MPFKDPQKALEYKRAWEARNREKRKEQSRAWKRANSDYVVDARREYRKRPRTKALNRHHRQRRKQRKFLTPEYDKPNVEAIYQMAQTLPGYEVDHIIPFAGDRVCGLHVSWNLQIITRQENRSKGKTLKPPTVH